MATRLTPEQVRRAQQLVSTIQGVSSCRVSTSSDGEITEIHVVATSGKPAKFIARDVETCLKAGMDIDVDHRKIGVVLVDGEDVGPEEPQVTPDQPAPADTSPPPNDAVAVPEEFPVEEYPSRFAFRSVNLFLSKHSTKAEVELSRDDLEAFGAVDNENTTATANVLIAQATLRAVSEFLDGLTRLCLGELRKIDLGDKEAIVVRVDLMGDRIAKSLAGCSIVSVDENQAVVFATLDAVNRVIGKLDFRSSIEYKIR